MTHGDQEALLRRWAADTWRSLVAMTDGRTALVADNIDADLRPETCGRYTSPTNIGGLLWSAICAERLGIIGAAERSGLTGLLLATLDGMRRHDPSGMFFNWYDPADGSVVVTDPDRGTTIHPFLSSVDNGWLMAGLVAVAAHDPAQAALAHRTLDRMDLTAFHDPAAVPGVTGGLLRGGFWTGRPDDHAIETVDGAGDPVFTTAHHYGILNSEPRIATYLGIALGQLPAEHYFALGRPFPAAGTDGDRGVPGLVPPVRAEHLGVPVDESARRYRDLQLLPTFGGSMFEELMPDLFVPESAWGPDSWGRNHPLAVRAQREFGLDDTGYGYWGFSPASRPGGGYDAWGAEPISAHRGGYPSDLEHTPLAVDGATSWGDGVVTPHAAFLAVGYETDAVVDNLARIETDLHAYGPGGFHDAVAVRSGLRAERHLSLDQAMIMGALGNHLADGVLHELLAPLLEPAVRPLLAQEKFAVGPVLATTGGAR
ncbi:cellobiose phosphorylase [Nakamurella sp. YIM 132087]|uniref:Cellobiose phosphorylase n=1 Tax=Nakamurella alba TaxID=2665158 RepID=A0A7K1FEW1_9ACTN|nr:glucoamylase family protein [Nakamurella alba]MTD12642.1 cellobiose phosphorylase [Nakamurella alba]